jgi:hypothetical protein
MHLARTMTIKSDGLNHQGGFFALFDPQTLEGIPHNYPV